MAKKDAQGKPEKGFRNYFVKLFEKYDVRNERQFITFGKWLLFIILVLVELLALVGHILAFETLGGGKRSVRLSYWLPRLRFRRR